MKKKPIIGSTERTLVYGIAAITDIIQIILDLFVATEVANHIIDIVFGVLLLSYGVVRKIWTGGKLMTLLAYFLGEQIPFLNALPFWTLDVKNMFSGIPKTEADQEAINPQDNKNGPLNMNGIRQPKKISTLNNQGIRAPRIRSIPPIIK